MISNKVLALSLYQNFVIFEFLTEDINDEASLLIEYISTFEK